ncbi:MAG: hypothetical protein K6F47_09915 [Bacteroidaceae bacterium]|nr:hypothetical protein [Bacteroidaceae bacterium]
MKKTVFTLLFATLCLGAAAQTENPRGIYRLMTLIGKNGEVNSPFHQYKVCTDSLTLQIVFQRNGSFRIVNNDHMVFNYTGDKPKSEDDKSILIYDSNADHFTEKWWSKFPNHIIFPHNDWCVEKYKAGEYTPESRIVFDALNGKAEVDAKNPLTGTWRVIGLVDDWRDIKKVLPTLHEKYPYSKYLNTFFVFTPRNFVLLNTSFGTVSGVTYDGKKAYSLGKGKDQIKWLTKDRIAVEEPKEGGSDWLILERSTDSQPPLSYIISHHIQVGPRALR